MRKLPRYRPASWSAEHEARQAAKIAAEADARHVKFCSRCTTAGDTYTTRCDEGWELAKTAHRTGIRLELWGDTTPWVQGELW